MRFALVTIETEHSRRSVRQQRAAHRSQIEVWMTEQGAAGKLVGGQAFETEAVGPVTVRHAPSGEVSVADGPFAGESRRSAVIWRSRSPTATKPLSWPSRGRPVRRSRFGQSGKPPDADEMRARRTRSGDL